MDSTEKERTILPAKIWSSIDFSELYLYRHLLFSLAWRDIKVRYSQTYIGIVWAIISPLITVVILSFIFQKVGNVDTYGQSPLLFTMVGYVAWMYFSTVSASAGGSIIESQNMIHKLYFPRIMLPLSKAISASIEFCIIWIFIIILMIYYNIDFRLSLFCIPFIIILNIICGIVGGIWISALTVRYRDFRFLIPFILQIGLFISPIAYPLSAVPEKYQFFYCINPIVGIIEIYRYLIFGIGNIYPSAILSFFIIFILLFIGIIYFSKVEKIMADIL